MTEAYKTIVIPRGAESQIPKVTEIVKTYINENMNGIDIGSAGAPIFVNSISMDRRNGHFSELVQLRGDARDLFWFKDGVLDYIFSSHCYEDFTEEEKVPVLKEWLRIVKPDGYIILLLPDEQKYRNFCASKGTVPNGAHMDKTFSMAKVVDIVTNHFPNLKVIKKEEIGVYSFIIVIKKLL